MSCISVNFFDAFQQQILEVISESQSLNATVQHLRESVRAECGRAEAAEASRDAALRAAEDARSDAAASAAGATHAGTTLTNAHDNLTSMKMQLEMSDRQRSLLEEKCSELSAQINATERDLQQLHCMKMSHANLQRQYMELQDQVKAITEQTQKETDRLENELRRVERIASGGVQLRERARLAAAAHARERRLSEAELRHAAAEILRANAEIARLSTSLAESQARANLNAKEGVVDTRAERNALIDARANLEAEKQGAAQLEKALSAALADNAALATAVAAADAARVHTVPPSTVQDTICNITAVDSFLAD